MIEGKGLEKLLDRKKYCSETPNYGPQKIRPKNPRTNKFPEFCEKLHTMTCVIHFRTNKSPEFWSK